MVSPRPAFEIDLRGVDTAFGGSGLIQASNDVLIEENTIDLTGGLGTGMFFDFGPNSFVVVRNNEIFENTDGGTGIFFNRVQEPSSFNIEGNIVGLTDQAVLGSPQEDGIIFQTVIGQVLLINGPTNVVGLLNPAFNLTLERPFFMPPGSNLGGSQITVNGQLVP